MPSYTETEERNLNVVRQMFGEAEGPADKTELFADDAVWWNGLPMIPNAVGTTEHRGIEAIRNILPSGGVKKHAPGETLAPVHMDTQKWIILAIGFVVSFLVAWGVVAWFMNWVRSRGFVPFAIYRIIVGIAVLVWVFKAA